MTAQYDGTSEASEVYYIARRPLAADQTLIILMLNEKAKIDWHPVRTVLEARHVQPAAWHWPSCEALVGTSFRMSLAKHSPPSTAKHSVTYFE